MFGDLPEITLFSTDKTLLTDAQPAIVTWNVIRATEVKLNGETVEAEGSRSFHSREPILLTLAAHNEVGEQDPETLAIAIDTRPPEILSFDIEPLFAIKGTAVTLRWATERAVKLIIDNNIGDVTGETAKTIVPRSNAIFILTAESYFGIKAHATATAIIFPIPLIKGLFIPEPQLQVKAIAHQQPAFNLQVNVFSELEINQPVFTAIDPVAGRILLNPEMINSVVFPNHIFKLLIQKQKEISYIVKSIWKKKARKILKRRLRRD